MLFLNFDNRQSIDDVVLGWSPMILLLLLLLGYQINKVFEGHILATAATTTATLIRIHEHKLHWTLTSLLLLVASAAATTL